jgi:hypothetical protein
MIKALTAHTSEMDDLKFAVDEILGQLDLEENLLAHSVGIVSCFAEFADSGVLGAIAAALPFPLVGTTTIACLAQDARDYQMQLTLMVLTSDTASFATALTDPITREDADLLKTAYQNAADQLDGTPDLILSFAPLGTSAGGDFLIGTMNQLSKGVPNFGTVAVDHTVDYKYAYVLFGSSSYRDRYAFILIKGVEFAFSIASISGERVLRDTGIVTKAYGNQVKEINHHPAIDYLNALGITGGGADVTAAINAYPFIVDYCDGTKPVIRAIFGITPEGAAICGGDIPEGAAITLGRIDREEVLNTSPSVLKASGFGADYSALLLYSCVGRYFSLDFDSNEEMEQVEPVISSWNVPYMFAYSGSELCPVAKGGEKGGFVNRNHNCTLVMCCIR